ncbi:hypothetical protein C7447_10576 [Tenacibaculum adriaticum]|uniref:Uncharacterized protein n=2 Tax=Tenacibaculum adriaticum TaxID=413713 RepID=A0A5S5DMA7_9FLAO|nr:hypothetical protein C7447_10576 [Tenacibaculum adriaticum]
MKPMKYQKHLIFYLFLFFISSKAYFQSRNNYDNTSASKALADIQKTLKTDETILNNKELFEYIYTNHTSFPTISSESSVDEKLQVILPIYSQLTYISYHFLKNPSDSVSEEQAMLYATIGYQSLKLLTTINNFMKSLDKNDPSYSTRMNGYYQGLNGIQQMMEGYIITTFIENQNTKVDDILVSSIYEFGPKIMKEFPVERSENLINQFEDKATQKDYMRLSKEYNKLIEVLKVDKHL